MRFPSPRISGHSAGDECAMGVSKCWINSEQPLN